MTERTEFLQRSLADLDAEHAAGDLSDEDYAQLRRRYLDALERAATSDESGRDTASPAAAVSRRQWPRTVAVVVAVVGLAAAAGVLVARSSGERVAGQASSGSVEQGSTDRLARAQQLVAEGKVLDAIKQYDAILKTDPDNPEALAQRGWLLRNAGLVDEGLEYIERAIAADAGYAEAHFFKGMILWRDKGDAAAAVPELRLFLAATPNPQEAAQVESLLQQAQAEAGTTTVPQQ